MILAVAPQQFASGALRRFAREVIVPVHKQALDPRDVHICHHAAICIEYVALHLLVDRDQPDPRPPESQLHIVPALGHSPPPQ